MQKASTYIMYYTYYVPTLLHVLCTMYGHLHVLCKSKEDLVQSCVRGERGKVKDMCLGILGMP